MNRRRFFVMAFFAALAGSLMPGRATAAVLPAMPPNPLRVTRLRSGHFLVNGWVLTARDLRELGLHDR